MPHQCVRCDTFYEDGSEIILNGCKCGGKLFFFVKKDKLDQARAMSESIRLTDKQKEEMESDIFDLVGRDIDADEPVVLDLESIRVTQPGKYELDLVHLFKGEPLIFKLEEGKYIIDVIQSFSQVKKK